jgi:hypothetical protein
MFNAAILLTQVGVPAGSNAVAQWWEIAAGILAIPAAVIGLLYTYRLTQKTRLETRKLQLEILEKEGTAPLPRGDQLPQMYLTSTHSTLVLTLDFILRFIIYYLALTAWGIVAGLISGASRAASIVLSMPTSFGSTDASNSGAATTLRLLELGIPVIGRIAIFVLLGWPLLKDIARFAGLSPASLIRRGQG